MTLPAPRGRVAVLAAGTSDGPVAAEAAMTAQVFGAEAVRVDDIGVAGLHRLIGARDEFTAADCLIVVAGMEGALPSVVGGLTGQPLVAVPTSVGYGASFGGLAALLAMLNSCAPGVVVTNIDNGFGAGVLRGPGRAAERTGHGAERGMIGWLDLSSGASGDMLLGALVDAGVPLGAIRGETDRLGIPVELRAEAVTRAGLAATQVHVDSQETDPPHRGLPEIRELLARLSPACPGGGGADLRAARRRRVAGARRPSRRGPFPRGRGARRARGRRGRLRRLRRAGIDDTGRRPARAGRRQRTHRSRRAAGARDRRCWRSCAASGAPASGGGSAELCTPTGAALVTTHATSYGPLPPMRVTATGSRRRAAATSPAGPNVLRLVLGEPVSTSPEVASVVISANVDDLDPRAWPAVLETLLAAGADDAWLTPILMKKGRPAHTVNALVTPHRVSSVKAVLFRETSTLGLREATVVKTALHREFRTVEVDGRPIAMKLGRADDGAADERHAGVGRRRARGRGAGSAGQARVRPRAGGVRTRGRRASPAAAGCRARRAPG